MEAVPVDACSRRFRDGVQLGLIDRVPGPGVECHVRSAHDALSQHLQAVVEMAIGESATLGDFRILLRPAILYHALLFIVSTGNSYSREERVGREKETEKNEGGMGMTY